MEFAGSNDRTVVAWATRGSGGGRRAGMPVSGVPDDDPTEKVGPLCAAM